MIHHLPQRGEVETLAALLLVPEVSKTTSLIEDQIPIIITITIDPHALIIPQHTTEIHHPHQHQVQIHPHVPQDPPAEDLVAVNKMMRSPLCIPSVVYQPTEYSAILIFTSFA